MEKEKIESRIKELEEKRIKINERKVQLENEIRVLIANDNAIQGAIYELNLILKDLLPKDEIKDKKEELKKKNGAV